MKRALLLTVVGLLSVELALRFFVRYQPGYYTGFRDPQRGAVYHFPYGDIRFNADGFPDDPFSDDGRARVGWFGDSVAFGVGAGQGYRIPDLLGQRFPKAEHRCFAAIGDGFTEAGARRVVELARRYRLRSAVYLMNLNDLLPSDPPPPEDQRRVRWLAWIRRTVDTLRGRSYLYTILRGKIADALAATGLGTHGLPAVEFFPARHDAILVETAQRIRRAAAALAREGRELMVVILPYEMQISAAAARYYRGVGVRWEAGFPARSPQRRLRALLNGVRVLDAAEAFPDPARSALGEYFVFDRGGRLDWNHPNRAGHARIASWLAGTGVFHD